MLRLAGYYWELLQPIKAAWWVEVTSCVAPSLPVFSQPSPSVCGDDTTRQKHLRAAFEVDYGCSSLLLIWNSPSQDQGVAEQSCHPSYVHVRSCKQTSCN